MKMLTEDKFMTEMLKLQEHFDTLRQLIEAHKQGKQDIEMYNIAAACEKLRISRTTFDRYVKEGKIKTIKVMGKKYVSRNEIDKYLSVN